jgi:hypothetical protein
MKIAFSQVTNFLRKSAPWATLACLVTFVFALWSAVIAEGKTRRVSNELAATRKTHMDELVLLGSKRDAALQKAATIEQEAAAAHDLKSSADSLPMGSSADQAIYEIFYQEVLRNEPRYAPYLHRSYRRSMYQHFEKLFPKLALAPELLERLKELLVTQMENRQDIENASHALGASVLSTSASFCFDEERNTSAREIKNLIGEEKFRLLDHFETYETPGRFLTDQLNSFFTARDLPRLDVAVVDSVKAVCAQEAGMKDTETEKVRKKTPVEIFESVQKSKERLIASLSPMMSEEQASILKLVLRSNIEWAKIEASLEN